ncbi:hypothetical protein [Christiangramia portivictoriae]|uniref:hypothetical protein n=1 Tax=Christiangramia portivictoriae TaxID=326069 RepID=UPI00047D49BC|nr:hypothetical protein [Christiangramia portivictoriae]
MLALKAGANIQRFFFTSQNFFNKIFGFFFQKLPYLYSLSQFLERRFVFKAGANIKLLSLSSQIKFKEI